MLKTLSIYGQFIDQSKLLMVNPLIGFFGVFYSPHSFWGFTHFGPTADACPALTMTFPRWTGAGQYQIGITVYIDYKASKLLKHAPKSNILVQMKIESLDEYSRITSLLTPYGNKLAAMELENISFGGFNQIFNRMAYVDVALTYSGRAKLRSMRLNRLHVVLFDKPQPCPSVLLRQTGKATRVDNFLLEAWERYLQHEAIYRGKLEASLTPYPLDMVFNEHKKSRKHFVEGEVDVDYMQLYRDRRATRPIIGKLFDGTPIQYPNFDEGLPVGCIVNDPHFTLRGHETLTGRCRTLSGKSGIGQRLLAMRMLNAAKNEIALDSLINGDAAKAVDVQSPWPLSEKEEAFMDDYVEEILKMGDTSVDSLEPPAAKPKLPPSHLALVSNKHRKG